MSTEALLSKTVSVKIHTRAHVYDLAFHGVRSRQSRYETVGYDSDEGDSIQRVTASTGLFCSARDIGLQALVGMAVDEERWAGKTTPNKLF